MASEATIARSLRDARFQDALNIPPAIDPTTLQTAQDSVDRDIDGLRQARAERGAMGATYDSPRTRNFVEKLRAFRRASRVTDSAGNVAQEATNKAYTQVLNTWQSSLLGTSIGMEIFISPWLFLAVFFMRVIASIYPVRVKGVNLVPPYTLKDGGVGVLISHLGGAVVIFLVLMIIISIIALVAMFLTQPEKNISLMFDLTKTGLKVLYDFITS